MSVAHYFPVGSEIANLMASLESESKAIASAKGTPRCPPSPKSAQSPRRPARSVARLTVLTEKSSASKSASKKADASPSNSHGKGAGSDGATRLHQIALVRRREGISRRTLAKRMGIDLKTIKKQEEQGADLSLSQLYQWQKALGVPVGELLADGHEPLSAPVLRRAQLVRLMKTAASIQERAKQASIGRMAQMLIDQLVEIMPELKQVHPWNTIGMRRTMDELGQAASRCLSNEIHAEELDYPE